ncbi:MAG: aconitate hydratase protein [Clostridiales bacterium]|nr:aconitate hydratase protein [Clostridiales bacterium]
MVKIINNGVYLYNNRVIEDADNFSAEKLNKKLEAINEAPCVEQNIPAPEKARTNTIAYGIMSRHNVSGNDKALKIKFDSLASHDITYVGIVQTSRASGLKEFPVPYVLTNCHNSLCAVGGTINEDDHVFGLSAAKKYGGIFVPAHQAVIHQFVREMMTGCGKMILGSDSHTRYGALGTMGIGEGGPEIVKQLLKNTYDVAGPEVIAVYLDGKPKSGVGPQDVALAIIGAVFNSGFVKNKVLEFVGPGINNLSVDYRNGIDVMTTETTCLSSIWCTDEKVKEYFSIHGRPQEYSELKPGKFAYYDGAVMVDLGKVEAMIALPFHPSNVYSINELNANAADILRSVEVEAQQLFDNPNIRMNFTDKIINGKLQVDQGIIAGCSGGTFENICEAAAILENKFVGNDDFALSVYPASQPINFELMKNGSAAKLLETGAIMRTAFCGPCFGAGDVPANNALSIRHTTRNFPSREGSKPGQGQFASVALMDARSIAATALNGGILTPATDLEIPQYSSEYTFNKSIYEKRVYFGFNEPDTSSELKFGPNIADWPEMINLTDNILLKMVTVIKDPVTTTDELIPSGETSSFRSNPLKLAEFTLSRKDPNYVGKAKVVNELELLRRNYVKEASSGEIPQQLADVLKLAGNPNDLIKNTSLGSVIFANKPGDGSAREQAASCQRVLGGSANFAIEYATKRYRSNLINWGMLPFTVDPSQEFNYEEGLYIFIPGIREKVEHAVDEIDAQIICKDGIKPLKLILKNLTNDEREIILSGSLINYYAKKNAQA